MLSQTASEDTCQQLVTCDENVPYCSEQNLTKESFDMDTEHKTSDIEFQHDHSVETTQDKDNAPESHLIGDTLTIHSEDGFKHLQPYEHMKKNEYASAEVIFESEETNVQSWLSNVAAVKETGIPELAYKTESTLLSVDKCYSHIKRDDLESLCHSHLTDMASFNGVQANDNASNYISSFRASAFENANPRGRPLIQPSDVHGYDTALSNEERKKEDNTKAHVYKTSSGGIQANMLYQKAMEIKIGESNLRTMQLSTDIQIDKDNKPKVQPKPYRTICSATIPQCVDLGRATSESCNTGIESNRALPSRTSAALHVYTPDLNEEDVSTAIDKQERSFIDGNYQTDVDTSALTTKKSETFPMSERHGNNDNITWQMYGLPIGIGFGLAAGAALVALIRK